MWQKRHHFLLDDPVRRKDFLDAHLSFMGGCVDKLQTTTNMGGIAEIILLMLDTPTATDERIHAAQFYSWYPVRAATHLLKTQALEFAGTAPIGTLVWSRSSLLFSWLKQLK